MGLNNEMIMSLVRKTVKKNKCCYFDVPFLISLKQNVSESSPYFAVVSLSPCSAFLT